MITKIVFTQAMKAAFHALRLSSVAHSMLAEQAFQLHFSCILQDPLGLGKTPSSLERFQEAELMNGR